MIIQHENVLCVIDGIVMEKDIFHHYTIFESLDITTQSYNPRILQSVRGFFNSTIMGKLDVEYLIFTHILGKYLILKAKTYIIKKMEVRYSGKSYIISRFSK